jgi:S1-C subfamily serine protease
MDLPDAVDTIRTSVVQIGVRTDAGSFPTHTLGTGFIVDDRSTIVTALHVLEAGADFASAAGHRGEPEFVAGLPHPQLFKTGEKLIAMQGFSYVDLKLLSAVPDHDLAAARLTENVVGGEWDSELVPVVEGVPVPPLAGVATLDPTRPREGSAVAVSGYPFAMNSLVTNSGCIASAFFPSFAEDPDADVREPQPQADDAGTRVRQEETSFEGPGPAERYLADLEVNGGNSGGPVYLVETATVIGVCVATRSAPVTRAGAPVVLDGQVLAYSSGLTVVIPSPYVKAMLDDDRVSSS